jgi:uncharacterized glyoxalase superfamily protein PhnB
MKEKFFDHTVPFLPVSDLQETIAYYRDTLGFTDEWFWENTDAGISRDDMHLLFSRNPSFVEAIKAGGGERGLEIMWFVENVDDIYAELQEKGVSIAAELQEEDWGVKEFAFKDINGYYIRVAEGLEEEEDPEGEEINEED